MSRLTYVIGLYYILAWGLLVYTQRRILTRCADVHLASRNLGAIDRLLPLIGQCSLTYTLSICTTVKPVQFSELGKVSKVACLVRGIGGVPRLLKQFISLYTYRTYK